MPAEAGSEPDAERLVLVVDVANVMGSRPDGWWRDRAGAASRLMAALAPLLDGVVDSPASASAATDSGGSARIRLTRIIAVTEGQARTAVAPVEVEVRVAPADGDTSIVAVAEQVLALGDTPLVVTADRGLRARLPAGSQIAGPRWLLDRTIGR